MHIHSSIFIDYKLLFNIPILLLETCLIIIYDIYMIALPIKTQEYISPFRKWIAPLFLIIFTPFITILVWMTAVSFNGSLKLFLQTDSNQWIALLPRPSFKALLVIVGWIFSQWVLLRFLPGKKSKGPLTVMGNRPAYKLNGILAWIITHGVLFGILYPLGIVNPASLYLIYGSVLITLNIGALLLCFLLYIKGRFFPSTTDTVYTGNFLFDFFQGIELYPTIAGVSLKQLISCRVSMMGWSVIFISFLLAQYKIYGFISSSMMVSVTILVIYLLKFFTWEKGYLHSLDIMHDRLGYYLCWGLLVWVPSVYCIVPLFLITHPLQLSLYATIGFIALGLISIWINYSADSQRRRVRDNNGNTTIWGKSPKIIHAKYRTKEGKEHTNILLTNGWWGISRHFHYIPELTLTFAWTLPVGFTYLLPWFYFIFLFILLMDRAIRDEKRCAKKYGESWKRYTQLVRYKVFPGIF